MNKNKKIWIVSANPASTSYGDSNESLGQFLFKEEMDLTKLKSMISEFGNNLGELFDTVENPKTQFRIDTIELNAVMAADGKLGILGSSIGTKVEGAIKFVLKRN